MHKSIVYIMGHQNLKKFKMGHIIKSLGTSAICYNMYYREYVPLTNNVQFN